MILFGAVIHVWFWSEKQAALGHSWSEEKHIKPETTKANSLIHIKMATLDIHARSCGVFAWLILFLGWTSKHCLLKLILLSSKKSRKIISWVFWGVFFLKLC